MNPDMQFGGRRVGSIKEAPKPARWKISGALFIECPTCGFEPTEQRELPRHACPKCLSDTWRRRLRPRRYADAS